MCLCVCLCFIGCVFGCSCLVVLVVGSCGCLCGTWHGLVVSLWHFGWPWGSIVTPWASILTHLIYIWESFGHFGAPLGSIWVPLGSMLVSCGHFGVWPWTPRATFVEKALEETENVTTWGPNWELLGTHFQTFSLWSRAANRFVVLLCVCFVDSVFGNVSRQVFRGKA